MAESKGEKRTRWHRLLAKLLEKTLTPVGISVFADFPIMGNPPEADILLLRNEKEGWTRAQKARLPDGIRDCRASHVLLEFKYAESVSGRALAQTVSYDHFFRQSQKKQDVPDGDIRTFLISSKTPTTKTLSKFGFAESLWAGVFRSENVMLENIPLISLNDLSDEPHNAFFKMFASRRHEKQVSFDSLMKNEAVSSTPEIMWLVGGLADYWLCKGGHMKGELTPKKVRELGKKFQDALIAGMPFERWLEEYGKDRILAELKPEDRLAGLKLEDRLVGLSVEELESYLKKLKKKKK